MKLGDEGGLTPSVNVRDWTVPYHTRTWSTSLWMGLFMIAGILSARLWLPSWLQYSVFAIVPLPIMLILERLPARRACRALRRLASRAPIDLDDYRSKFVAVLSRYTSQTARGWAGRFRRHNVAALFAEAMLERGEAGTVFRLAGDPARLGDAPAPWPEPFEPIPLREHEPALTALRGADAALRSKISAYFEWSFADSTSSRRTQIIAIVFLSFIALMSLYLMMLDLLVGQVPEMVYALWPALVLLIVFQLWLLWRPSEWFLVPGAVIVRSSRWNSSRWEELHLMRRADAVLVYWSDLRLLAIAEKSGRHFVRHATLIEAEVAIRAWLSPLPPPSVEQLGDLR